ncbi:MAG: hypothetical protein IJS89_01560 [Bacteroidaceae bacterium]|nr:hypothetical protein [Bacteroidaceae bacterium]
MKKYFILLSLLALPFAFVGCGGDDDDNNSYVGKELTETQFQELADKFYQITQESGLLNGTNIEEIVLKLTEDGLALLQSKGGDILGNISTRALKDADGGQYAYVSKYTRNGDEIILVDLGGTFNLSNNTLTLDAGPLAAQSLVMSTIISRVSIAEVLNRVCRTWNIIQTNIKVEGGDLGSDSYSKNFRVPLADDLVAIAADIDAQPKLANVKMGPNLEENGRLAKITSVSISKNGSILIVYSNGKWDIGEVKSIGADGKVDIDWPDDFYSNEYLSGELGISAQIESNCLRLAFNSKVNAEGVNEPYKVRVEFVMEWAN